MLLRLKSEPVQDQKTKGPSLKDWVTLNAKGLRELCLEPAERLNVTGHRVHLSALWSRSVGGWCLADTDYFVGEGGVVEHATRKAFDIYKYRHGLRTARQFQKLYGKADWQLAETVYDTYAHHQKLRGGLSGYGEPAEKVGLTVGVLPIEAVLNVTLFQEFLEHNKIDRPAWRKLEKDERKYLWTQGRGPNQPWSASAIYVRPYVDPYGG